MKACKSDLQDLEKLLAKYKSLKTSDPRTRDRLGFSSNRQSEIRVKLSGHTDRLNLLLTQLNTSALGRIEVTTGLHTKAFREIKAKLDSIHQDMLTGKKDPALLASMEDWGSLEKELVDDNITEVDVELNKDYIAEWLESRKSEVDPQERSELETPLPSPPLPNAKDCQSKDKDERMRQYHATVEDAEDKDDIPASYIGDNVVHQGFSEDDSDSNASSTASSKGSTINTAMRAAPSTGTSLSSPPINDLPASLRKRNLGSSAKFRKRFQDDNESVNSFNTTKAVWNFPGRCQDDNGSVSSCSTTGGVWGTPERRKSPHGHSYSRRSKRDKLVSRGHVRKRRTRNDATSSEDEGHEEYSPQRTDGYSKPAGHPHQWQQGTTAEPRSISRGTSSPSRDGVNAGGDSDKSVEDRFPPTSSDMSGDPSLQDDYFTKLFHDSDFANLFRDGMFGSGGRGYDDRPNNHWAGPAVAPAITILEKDLPVSLDELFTGTMKKMKIKRKAYDSATGKQNTQDRILEVPIKRGLRAGSKIKFADVGDQGPNATQDLHFIIKEVHAA